MNENVNNSEITKLENASPLINDAEREELKNAFGDMGFGSEMLMNFIEPALPKIISMVKGKILPQAITKLKEFLGNDEKRIEVFCMHGVVTVIVYFTKHDFEISFKEGEKKFTFTKDGIAHRWSVEQFLDNFLAGDIMANLQNIKKAF